MEVSGQVYDPATLPPGKNSRYPLDRRLGRPQVLCVRGGEENNSCPCRQLNPGRPARSSFIIVIELWYMYFLQSGKILYNE